MNSSTTTPSGQAPHLVIVYPQDTSSAALGDLARRLVAALHQVCTEAPVPVRPNMTALCLLVHGPFDAIRRAVDDVTDAYSHWLVVRVGTPHASSGLSTAQQWLARH